MQRGSLITLLCTYISWTTDGHTDSETLFLFTKFITIRARGRKYCWLISACYPISLELLVPSVIYRTEALIMWRQFDEGLKDFTVIKIYYFTAQREDESKKITKHWYPCYFKYLFQPLLLTDRNNDNQYSSQFSVLIIRNGNIKNLKRKKKLLSEVSHVASLRH